MSSILIEKNIMVPMRDGVCLATDVHRLQGSTPAPVLMARTPYNKEFAVGSTTFDIFRAVQAGYIVVIQDVRGRYASDGKFHPHFQETQDGFDAFAWAAAQPWANGVIYELRLNLWATANVFLPGHCIRLEVSSSNFPRFDRNSNTGGVIAREVREQYQPAVNHVFHDAVHPSHLILPIIER